MNPLWILLIGMGVVIGGILLLRLHPFLSLIAGALVVAPSVAGATMTHSLVPPAAGPAGVAAMLHVELHEMILGGICGGAIASTSGYLYALWANRRWDIPLRPSLSVSKAQLDELAARDESTLPPLSVSLLPIIVPVLLIATS